MDSESFEGRIRSPDQLSTLAIELLLRIVSYLPPSSLARLGRTNKYFSRLLFHSEDFEFVWMRCCTNSFGFCLTRSLEQNKHQECVNELLYQSWKQHNPDASQHLAKARGYQSSHVGYAGTPSSAYDLFKNFKHRFRFAEQLIWYCLLDPSPVFKAYAIEGCIQLFKENKSQFPRECFLEVLFHVAVQILPYTLYVETLSGCCGGTASVTLIILRFIKPLLNEAQLQSLDEAMLQCSSFSSNHSSEIERIKSQRASRDSNRSSKTSHPKQK